MLYRLLLFSLIFLTMQACRQRNGCTDPAANNFVEEAENDDGSCRYDSELFKGRWKVRDSIVSGTDLKAEEEKILTIINNPDNQAEIKLVWRYAGGQNSDTLDAKLVPLAISIPSQPFGNKLCRGSIIYMFYSNDPVQKIRISYILTDQWGNSVELRGTGDKLP
jgi:hypothetical protein